MRCRVQHPAGIDGIAHGGVGEFPDNAAVRGLIRVGLLAPEGGAPLPAARSAVVRVETSAELDTELTQMRARFDASWTEREAAYARELAAKDTRVTELEWKLREVEKQRDAAQARTTELEVEVAQLRIDLETATAPAKPAEV